MSDIALMQQVVELARQAGKAILPYWRLSLIHISEPTRPY